MGSEASAAPGRRQNLDGVRGVAVSLVIVGHVFGVAGSVYVMIDAFFVLSGFFLTHRLIAAGRATGRVPVGSFFAARAVRLGPPLLLTLVVTFVLSALTHGNVGTTTPTWLAALMTAAFAGNWFMVTTNSSLGYLSHTWFLSMEEQFYLCLPLLAAWILRRPSRAIRGLMLGVAAIAAVRLVLSCTVSSQFTLWTPLRADGMLLGALVAVGWSRRATLQPRLRLLERPAAGWTAAGSILGLCAVMNASGHALRASLSGGSTLVGVATAVLLWHFLAAPSSNVSRFFALRPLAATGRWAYGLYLFHFPFYMYALAQDWSPAARLCFVGVATAATTALSWNLLERPAMRMLGRRAAAPRSPAAPPPDAGGQAPQIPAPYPRRRPVALRYAREATASRGDSPE